jgi:Berberine and berberine like
VKNKYDPTNLFRRNQNIKPTVERATVGVAVGGQIRNDFAFAGEQPRPGLNRSVSGG